MFAPGEGEDGGALEDGSRGGGDGEGEDAAAAEGDDDLGDEGRGTGERGDEGIPTDMADALEETGPGRRPDHERLAEAEDGPGGPDGGEGDFVERETAEVEKTQSEGDDEGDESEDAVDPEPGGDEVGDVGAALLAENGGGIGPGFAFREGEPTREGDAEAEIEDAEDRGALSEKEPESELFLPERAEKHRHEDEPEEDRQAAAEPGSGRAEEDASMDGHGSRKSEGERLSAR